MSGTLMAHRDVFTAFFFMMTLGPSDNTRCSWCPLYCCLKGHVIKAWDIGVHSMQKGEVCILMCKPEYAYGSVGIPPKIPPNSTLLFEVGNFYRKTFNFIHAFLSG